MHMVYIVCDIMLLVFVNPRSGGNQGARLIQKFNFYLNPRQVFDLSLGGPRQGLELYKKVKVASDMYMS